MNRLRFPFLLVLVAGLAAAGGWWGHLRWGTPTASNGSTNGAEAGLRRVLFYQSPMHPWIKSDAPGRCTICGMELSPVHEGDSGFGGADGVVGLGSNSVQVLNVQTTRIQRGPLRRTLRVAGTIDDNDRAHRILSAYTDGRIDRLFVNYIGAEVTAGQPLAAFYSPVLLAAQREYQMLARPVVGTTASGTGGEIVAAAAQRLRQLGLTEEQIAKVPHGSTTNLHTEVLAPMSGTVVARQVYEGQYVKEGERLFEIADFSVMWFLFDAYERDLAWLAPGQKVDLTTPSRPGVTLAGVIAFIDPNLNPQTRSTKVRVELPNPIVSTNNGHPQRALLHRLYADAVVHVATTEVLLVPRSAVLAPGTAATVYVDRSNGAYEARRIQLGRVGDDSWEVIEGLVPGEVVVTSGNLLIDGQAQMNGLHTSPGPGGAPPPAAPIPVAATTNWPDLTPSQRMATESWLSLVAGLAASLANDDLKSFAMGSAAWPEKSQSLTNQLTGASHLAGFASRLTPLKPPTEFADIAAARHWFHPAAQAAAVLAELARHQSPPVNVRVFECPMVNAAIPNVPKKGRWVQLDGELRNPFFGAAMLTCGKEVFP